MSDVFREVDEEVRKDQALTLWNRYGRALIGGVVGIVVATAVWQGWSAWSLSQRQADAEQFLFGLTLMAQERPGAAEAAFAQLAADAGAGYQALAQLQQAAALISAGDRAAGVAVFDALAGDGGMDRTLRDLASLLAAQSLLDTADSQTLGRRLAPLMAESNPWRFSARELAGLAAIRHGDLDLARSAFAQLTDDPATPQGIRARAAELLAAIGDGG